MNELDTEIRDMLDGSPEPIDNDPSQLPPTPPEPPTVDPPEPGSNPPEPPVEPTNSDPAVPPVSTPPAAEPPVAPVPPSDPRDIEIATLKDTVAQLQKMVNDVAAQSVNRPTAIEDPTPVSSGPHKFFEKEEDVDEALKTVDGVNGMLWKAVEKANEIIPQTILPQIVGLVDQLLTQRFAVNDFYTANPDLASNKAYVGVVADEIAKANPEWNLLQVMEKLGDEVRGRLRLGKPGIPAAEVPPTPSENSPAFVPGSRTTRPNPSNAPVSGVAKEIADMLAIDA